MCVTVSNLSNSCLYEGECCSRVSAGEAVAVVDIFRHCLAVHDADESNSNDRWGKKAVAEERQYNASSLVALCCLVNDSIISLFCAVSYHTDFIRILSGFYRRTRPGMDPVRKKSWLQENPGETGSISAFTLFFKNLCFTSGYSHARLKRSRGDVHYCHNTLSQTMQGSEEWYVQYCMAPVL